MNRIHSCCQRWSIHRSCHNGRPQAPPRRSVLYGLFGVVLFAAHSQTYAAAAAGAVDATDDVAAVAVVEFSEQLLRIPVDVSMFAVGNPVPAGNYRVDLNMNGQWKGRTDVRFDTRNPGDLVALPCFDAALLEILGFDSKHFTAAVQGRLLAGEQLCQPLGEIIEGAGARYQHSEFRLDVSAPQVLLKRDARGYVDPALWDNGITAATVQYDYNMYRSEMAGRGQTSQYLGLRAGFNLGTWRLRYRGSASHRSGAGAHYRSDVVYVERSLPGLRSRLTLGETVTDGQVFDSLSFLGAKLDSDDRMYPESQRGYAPVVRGVAQSNAKVEISQRGVPIYEITVPPGAFYDLYPNGIGGDLLVTVTEADGSQSQFTVSYSAVAELLRPGFTKYSLLAGQYSNRQGGNDPLFVMGTLRRGLSNTVTGYTGLLAGEGYSSVAAGLAFNLPIGAVSADITHASTQVRGVPSSSGHSMQVSYSKILPVIDTNVTVASYRYSSNGFYSPSEAFQLRDGIGSTWWLTGGNERQRNRLVINAQQTLPGNWGMFSISVSSQDYWLRDGRDTQYQASYGRSISRLSFGLSASRVRNTFLGRWDNQYTFNMTIPLDVGGSNMNLGTTLTHGAESDSLQANLSGIAGQSRQLGWNLFASAQDSSARSTQSSGGAGIGWTGSKARLGANISASNGGNRQYGFNLSGGMVAFGGGVVMSAQLGDTIAIVEAKDAGGAAVSNVLGVKLNRRGHAVVPWVQPFRQNSVSIDPKGLSTDVALASSIQRVAPTAGAVSLLRFETERGYSILLSGRRADGSYLPFAASVFDAKGQHVGNVSQGGQALVRVNALAGELTVRWGQAASESCQFSYSVPESRSKDSQQQFRRVEALCLQSLEAAVESPAENMLSMTDTLSH